MFIRIITLVLILTSAHLYSFGQVSEKDLIGTWTTNDIDSSYNLNTVVVFFQDANHWIAHNSNTCKTVDLVITNDSFKFKKNFRCTEPGRESWLNNQSIKLIGLPLFKKVQIETGEELLTFRILSYKEYDVDRYPHQIKELVLRQIK